MPLQGIKTMNEQLDDVQKSEISDGPAPFIGQYIPQTNLDDVNK